MPASLTLWMRVCNELAQVWQSIKICLLLEAEDLPEYAEPTPHRQYNGRIHPWTDVHSWLVVMGGMSFEDSAEEDQQFMPENRQRINITIEVFEYMLKMRDHLIPDILRQTTDLTFHGQQESIFVILRFSRYFFAMTLGILARQVAQTCRPTTHKWCGSVFSRKMRFHSSIESEGTWALRSGFMIKARLCCFCLCCRGCC